MINRIEFGPAISSPLKPEKPITNEKNILQETAIVLNILKLNLQLMKVYCHGLLV